MRDIVGTKHGRLAILSRLADRRDPDGHRRRYFLVRCECGTERAMREAVLRRNSTVSCGCWRLENHTTHGLSGTPIFEKTGMAPQLAFDFYVAYSKGSYDSI